MEAFHRFYYFIPWCFYFLNYYKLHINTFYMYMYIYMLYNYIIHFRVLNNKYLVLAVNCSLLVYRRMINFCVWALYLANLLYSLIASRSSFVDSWNYLSRQIYHVWPETVLFFSFKFYTSYIFSCLIALVRTFNIVLSRSGESWQLCLVADLREKALGHSPLSMMLALTF